VGPTCRWLRAREGGAVGWRRCLAGWAAMRCWAATVDQAEKTRGGCELLLIGPKVELG
jgi:hypothetical protein